MKILMATDGSAQATTALQTAVRLLRKGDNQFDLLCVAPEFSSAKGRFRNGPKKSAQMIETYRHRIRLEARQMLIRAQSALATAGVEAGTRVEIGSPARVISRMAGEADLTVVGAHDRYSRSSQGLGPVASRVVAFAPNTVLVGRELPEAQSWRILAAVDGSLAAQHALQEMVACLRVAQAEITLMHVVETPWIHLGLDREWFDYPGAADRDVNSVESGFEDELNCEARKVIEHARLILEQHGLSATTVTAEGDPALEILGELDRGEYDLVVLGATGGADLKHTMLGSVSTRVAQDAPCSVLVTKFAE